MKKKLLFTGLLFLTTLSNAQVPSDIPQKGLQAFWPFSGNAHDVSGNQRHGTPHGAIMTNDRFGNDSSAYSFNGLTNYITTQYAGILGSHPRAVSFWALAFKNGTGKALVVWGNNDQFPNAGGRFGCAFGGSFYKDYGDTYIGATIEVSDAGVTFEGQEPVDDGKWHHYVFQFDKHYVKYVQVYQDGMLLTHETHRFYKNCRINTRLENTVTFGALFNRNDTDSYFKGFLDDVAIYDRALSRDEINALYLARDPNEKTEILKWIPPFLGVILCVLLIIWFIRLRVKNLVEKEKEKIHLEKNWYEQENRVLKAQMDPHFIFNSLNSIQQFIIVNDNEKAQLYLSTFAQLIRMQLESNTSENISLKQEIIIIEKYLEIESLRFNNAFDHEIIIDKSINTGSLFIPYFLVQPFVENAIHHGLLPKIGYKELTITFEIINTDILSCTVDDNGIGRKNSGLKETPFKTKSLGVNFVEQRLLIMSKIDNRKYGVEITDKVNPDGSSAGMRATITMPIQRKQ
ncbi:MAG: histidine kinase [Bacteroidota bacterium]